MAEADVQAPPDTTRVEEFAQAGRGRGLGT